MNQKLIKSIALTVQLATMMNLYGNQVLTGNQERYDYGGIN